MYSQSCINYNKIILHTRTLSSNVLGLKMVIFLAVNKRARAISKTPKP